MSEIPALIQIYFYLTEGCNLACRHCWLAPRYDPELKNQAVLSVELFEQAITEALPLGLQGVKLTGGEPMLNPHFEKMLAILQHHDLELVIESNGILMTPGRAAAIARSSRRSISISMDGATAEVHDWVRGVPGAFEKAKRAIRLLVENGVGPQIIFSVMRANAFQVEDIIHLAEELGVVSIKFNIVQPTARGEKMHEKAETLPIAELIDLGRTIDFELTQKTSVSLFYDYPMAFRALSRLNSPQGYGVCSVHNILGVLATGEYALCGIGEHIPEMVFGYVGRDSLEKVWQDAPVLNQLRQDLPERLKGICASCVMRQVCLGSCIAENYYHSHDLMAPFWFCESAEAESLFPESRLNSPARFTKM